MTKYEKFTSIKKILFYIISQNFIMDNNHVK